MSATHVMAQVEILGVANNVLCAGDVDMMTVSLATVVAITIALCAGDVDIMIVSHAMVVVMRTAIIATETVKYIVKCVTHMVVSKKLALTATETAIYENNCTLANLIA